MLFPLIEEESEVSGSSALSNVIEVVNDSARINTPVFLTSYLYYISCCSRIFDMVIGN